MKECENCHFVTEVETYDYPEGNLYELCEVCYYTHLGLALTASEQVPDTKLYESIAWIANKTLKEIEKHNVIIPR